jgi:hypothetical protein
MIRLASSSIGFGYRTWAYTVFRRHLARRSATDDVQSGGDAYPSYPAD